jgi:hypothetical protein
VLRDPADVAESVFRRLFDQITLTPSQESSARALLLQLARDERAQADSVLPALAEFTMQRLAVQARRDSSLTALLTTDADRATFEAHREMPFGGGRRGGPPVVALNTEPGRGRSGGGRGGGRGTEPILLTYFNNMIPEVVDQTFRRLFDGIALTPAQETAARTIITTAVTEQTAIRPPAPRPTILRETPLTGIGSSTAVVVMSEEGRASILALVGSDADRATVDSRIGIANRPPGVPRPPQ